MWEKPAFMWDKNCIYVGKPTFLWDLRDYMFDYRRVFLHSR